jgi:hypothetical protein
MDDPQLKKLLREWQVENAPRSLDDRVLGSGAPWWKRLLSGSVRVPLPVAFGFAVLFVVMGVALMQSRRLPVPAPPATPAGINLADFRPVENVQVRIMRSANANQ